MRRPLLLSLSTTLLAPSTISDMYHATLTIASDIYCATLTNQVP